jgi:hypothetical protein
LKITHSSDKNIQENTHSSGKNVENTKSRQTAEISPKLSNLHTKFRFTAKLTKVLIFVEIYTGDTHSSVNTKSGKNRKFGKRTLKITHSSDKNVQQNTLQVENTKSRPTAQTVQFTIRSFHRQIDNSPNFLKYTGDTHSYKVRPL